MHLPDVEPLHDALVFNQHSTEPAFLSGHHPEMAFG